jgi:hypothetical protein
MAVLQLAALSLLPEEERRCQSDDAGTDNDEVAALLSREGGEGPGREFGSRSLSGASPGWWLGNPPARRS